MRITIGLPSRNRPAGLLTVLTALDKLSSGEHEINYAVALDDDDYVTLEQFENWEKAGMLPERVQKFVSSRDRTLNARMNDVYRSVPGDIYSQVCDDQYPMSLHWDKMIYVCRNLPAFTWTEATDPDNATFLVVSSKWFETTGRYTTEHFPFWFADTWLVEVYKLAFGMPISVINQLLMGHGQRGKTQGMRDLGFWFDFFSATRVERIEEAQKLAIAYGQPVHVPTDRQKELSECEAFDAFQRERVPHYEQLWATNAEPSKSYLNAKAAAEKWLSDHSRLAEAA